MPRSTDVIKQKLAICSTQCAGEKGLLSTHASFMLQETISHNVENGSNVFVAFFDTKKAFNMVWIDGLFYMPFLKGIRGKLWRLLRKSYLCSSTCVLVNGKLSSWFKIYQGVKQGSVVSMLL